jgi:predicted flap endonuclease-1-like 5' DNA nuclease
MRHGHLFALLVGLTVGLLARPAVASHYALADVPALVSVAASAKLATAGVTTTEALLQKGAKTDDRKSLAKATGLAPGKIMDLVRRCDLLRIKGVGSEMVLLLEAVGVKTVADLSKKEAGSLTASADQANKVKKITEKPPTEPQFQDWIEQAKKLPVVIEGK